MEPAVSNQTGGVPGKTDGQYGPENGEWAKVSPASFLNGESRMLAVLRPQSRDLTVMLDVKANDVTLEPGREIGPISFRGGPNRFFDVFVTQGGNNSGLGLNPPYSAGGQHDSVRVLLNGEPYDNSAGCIRGAVDRNATSPYFTGAHTMVELRVKTGAQGCVEPAPSFWSASLPVAGTPQTVAAAALSYNDAGIITVTPAGEGRFGDRACSDGVDNDGDGKVDIGDLDCAFPPVSNPLQASVKVKVK